MSITDKNNGWFPKTLSAAPSFLWWDLDVALPPVIAIVIGLYGGFLLLALLVACIYLYVHKHIVETLPKGFYYNFIYFFGYLSLDGYPVGQQNTFWE